MIKHHADGTDNYETEEEDDSDNNEEEMVIAGFQFLCFPTVGERPHV